MSCILYSTGCPKCNVLEKKLNEKGISYDVCDSVSVMEEMGITSLPVLDVDGTPLDFMSAVQWVNNQ